MATATFVKTGLVDTTDQSKSQAIVEVDGQEITIDFWYSVIAQYGKEGTKQFVCVEALRQTGNLLDAHTILQSQASGTLTLDSENKVVSDTRNWQKKWLDDYSIVIATDVPEIDPLA